MSFVILLSNILTKWPAQLNLLASFMSTDQCLYAVCTLIHSTVFTKRDKLALVHTFSEEFFSHRNRSNLRHTEKVTNLCYSTGKLVELVSHPHCWCMRQREVPSYFFWLYHCYISSHSHFNLRVTLAEYYQTYNHSYCNRNICLSRFLLSVSKLLRYHTFCGI
jgi:hypothetical protein